MKKKRKEAIVSYMKGRIYDGELEAGAIKRNKNCKGENKIARYHQTTLFQQLVTETRVQMCEL